MTTGAASTDLSLLIRESSEESLKKCHKNDLNSHYNLNNRDLNNQCSLNIDPNNRTECLSKPLSQAPRK